MIVADTSAWVELLRGTGHAAATTLSRLIDRDEDIAITEVVMMELLAGARPGAGARDLRARLLAFRLLPLAGLADFEEAAVLYRACRDAGETIRSLSDCLIAVPVLKADAELLHNDADFAAIARHSSLKIYPLRGR
ncbi:MAG: PIN domain nuclease [Chloroflexi bacterium]|nr:MAG: PIN domain nuclease [Chloroflexota bacterium]TMG40312.1 MAG: PIN domain nuclease [Chloroflexota bacterium]